MSLTSFVLDQSLRVSVVIPAYNAANYLKRALDSVLAQSCPPAEIVVVDDGSTDGTRAVVASYGSAVNYIYQTNGGVSVARNRGIRESSGDWIAFLDADDFWHTDKLRLQVAALRRHPGAILAYSDFTIVRGDRHADTVSPCTPPEKLASTLRFRCPFMPSVVVLRRQALLDASGFDVTLQGPEDWDLWFRLVQKHGTSAFVHIPQSLTFYCVVPGSLSQKSREQLRQCIGLLDRRLLDGLTGVRRRIWRRKILARLFRDAAVALREEGAHAHLRYMLRSLICWPFPGDFIQSDRYRLAAHMALRSVVTESKMKRFRNRLATTLYPVARLYMRYSPGQVYKRKVWEQIRRTICWRSSERIIHSDYGFAVRGDVSEYIYQCLYFFGTWEPSITRFVAERLRPGDSFIDVGANIGYYSLLSASLVGTTGRVVAIEASPRIYGQLTRNLELNSVKNVRTLNIAASHTKGHLDLFEGDNCLVTTTSPTWAKENRCDFVGRIEALPLGDALTQEELRTARIVKIDVEGAESSVCSGLFPILDQLREDAEITIEITPSEFEANGQQCSELIKQFDDSGFHAYVIENKYSADFYLSKDTCRRPKRLRKNYQLHEQTDLVLSRTDADCL